MPDLEGKLVPTHPSYEFGEVWLASWEQKHSLLMGPRSAAFRGSSVQ